MKTSDSSYYQVECPSLGECWLSVSRLILTEGRPSHWEGASIHEIPNLTLIAASPDPEDALIRRLGDPAWLAWMHENFFIQKEVSELKDAPSYAVRLFNYAGQGRDQIRWVIDRLRANPECRDATITTLMPLMDTGYIPCVSLLDFWIPAGALELVVYANALDFGKKAYGNLVELALLQRSLADALARPVGKLMIHVKTAHIYETEWDTMRSVCELSVSN